MLSHSGNVRRDSLEDRAFIAFSISMTTKLNIQISVLQFVTTLSSRAYIESDIVEAAFALLFTNISHPISGNWDEQRWKCDCLVSLDENVGRQKKLTSCQKEI